MTAEVRILQSTFVPYRMLEEYQQRHIEPGNVGACVNFVGTMRAHSADRPVDRLVLEHYPGMTERQLHGLIAQAQEHWQFSDALILHRVGELSPGDPIMLAAVWSVHRREAWLACRHLVEGLKSEAPFWKKEFGPEGGYWVRHNTPG